MGVTAVAGSRPGGRGKGQVIVMDKKEIQRVFQGKWITTESFCNLQPVNVFHRQLEEAHISAAAPQNSHILFRRHFEARGGIQTYIYISADDYYKLYINGRFVCQGPAPGYPFHYYYNKVDITGHIREGSNLIAVHTYYQGLINRVWVSGDDRHGLILDVEQGGETIVSSDESFRCTVHSGFQGMGKAGYDTQFLERYTSGSPQEGFERADYDDSGWAYAKPRANTDYILYEQPTKMLVFEEIRPTLAWDGKGVTADFGAVYVGYLYAEARGEKGSSIEVLSAQELEEDGCPRWRLRCNCDYREEWQLSGGADVLNQFDYKSFRYVRLNLPAGCRVENICLKARHYPFALQAAPGFQDPELLPVWNLCVNSLRYGVQETIQDCMEREKGNYLGDGCYTALAHYALTGDASILKKLVDDSLRSSFINRGLMTCAACSFMQEIAEYPLMVYPMLVRYHELSGDRAYLEECYDSLCGVLDYYREAYGQENGLLCNVDKWCVVEWPANYRGGYAADVSDGKVCTDMHNVVNAHYLGALKSMNQISAIAGRDRYCDEAPVEEAFYRIFYDPQKKLFRDKEGDDHMSLIANVFPFMYGLFPEEETKEAIVGLIEERGFTSVMLFGAYPILEGLRRLGRKEQMYQCLKDQGAWKRMLREGATTTFEGWGKETKWNTSLFHLTLSYGAMFLIEE